MGSAIVSRKALDRTAELLECLLQRANWLQDGLGNSVSAVELSPGDVKWGNEATNALDNEPAEKQVPPGGAEPHRMDIIVPNTISGAAQSLMLNTCLPRMLSAMGNPEEVAGSSKVRVSGAFYGSHNFARAERWEAVGCAESGKVIQRSPLATLCFTVAREVSVSFDSTAASPRASLTSSVELWVGIRFLRLANAEEVASE
jgi:hypothetical protein